GQGRRARGLAGPRVRAEVEPEHRVDLDPDADRLRGRVPRGVGCGHRQRVGAVGDAEQVDRLVERARAGNDRHADWCGRIEGVSRGGGGEGVGGLAGEAVFAVQLLVYGRGGEGQGGGGRVQQEGQVQAVHHGPDGR